MENNEKEKQRLSKIANEEMSKGFEIDPNDIPSAESLAKGQKIHAEALETVKEIYRTVEQGGKLNISKVRTVTASLISFSQESPSMFSKLVNLKGYDEYDYAHALNVAILCIALGKRLNKFLSDLQVLAMAGLLHDVGMELIPGKLHKKPGKLSAEEFQQIQNHTVLAYDIILASGLPKDVADAVLHHHERADGSGYPDGLTDRQIDKNAKVVALADVYDAITSDRIYGDAKTGPQTLKYLFQKSDELYDDTLVKYLVSMIGIYPAGTLVMLDSGEQAVVYKVMRDDLLRPKVLIVTDENGKKISPKYFDLTSYSIKTQEPFKKIVTAINPKDFNINPSKVINDFIKSASSGMRR